MNNEYSFLLTTNVPFAVDEPFVRQQVLDTERAAEVKFLRRYRDLGPEAEFASVGESGRGVVVHGGTIHVAQETFGSCGIGGHDRGRVPARIFVDPLDSVIDGCGHAYHDLSREKFLVPDSVIFNRADRRIGRTSGRIAKNFNTYFLKTD